MEQKIFKLRKILTIGVAGLVGTVMGMTLKSPTERARVIEKLVDTKIMKVYNRVIKDQILIENPENAGEYIPLSNYLKGFDNKDERNYAKEKIKYWVSQGEK